MTRPLRPLVTCEHGGNLVPERWSHLFPEGGKELESHRGWDPGALPLARYLAGKLPAPFRYTLTTRLLVDVNRNLESPELFSEFSDRVSTEERRRLIRRYHRRHWRKILRLVDRMIGEGGRVLHLGVHTFTPVFRGRDRSVDLGVLFDPERPREAEFARAWMDELRMRLPELLVRDNEPYRGTDDGLTAHLRSRFPADAYLGIELEVKQGPLVGSRPRGRRTRNALLESFRSAMKETVRSGSGPGGDP